MSTISPASLKQQTVVPASDDVITVQGPSKGKRGINANLFALVGSSRLTPILFAQLPSAVGNQGVSFYVTNLAGASLSAVKGTTAAGTGTIKAEVLSDGTNWIVQ
jgi:hypothetical protein